MARLPTLLLVALCACSAIGLTSAAPSPSASSPLDRIQEAIARASPALDAVIAAVDSVAEAQESIPPEARVHAAKFIQRIETLISSLPVRIQPPSDRRVPDLYEVPAHEHVQLEAVEATPAPLASEFSDSPYQLHPVNLAPHKDTPSGVNFTSFLYPTKEGMVTLWVGVTEYPTDKFHFYPSPRDADRDTLMQRNEINLARLHASEQGRKYSARQGSPMQMALFNLRAAANPLCDGVAATSVSANHYGCELAMNAGFFNMATGGCMGDVVSKGKIINRAQPNMQGHSHFGITNKGNYITGYMTEAEVTAGVDGGFMELAQGNGWLIREGKRYINESAKIEGLSQSFLAIKAPRNAVGHDSRGRLLQFEADGEEDIDLGLTLWEFADILATHFDVTNAINVDGGGSSTTVYKGKVVSRPTCRDTPEICERSVTTISCVEP